MQELTEVLDTSESTIRRDLTTLHKKGSLIKVHGGVTVLQGMQEYFGGWIKHDLHGNI